MIMFIVIIIIIRYVQVDNKHIMFNLSYCYTTIGVSKNIRNAVFLH